MSGRPNLLTVSYHAEYLWSDPVKHSSKLIVIVAAVAFVVSQTYLISLLHFLRPNLIELQLTFSPDRYWEILALWGDAGRQAYRDHFAHDFLHIAIFSIFGYLLARGAGLFGPGERALELRVAAILPVAGLFDLGENLLQLRLLSGQMGFASIVIPVSALCSSAKWMLAAVFAWITAHRLLKRLWTTSH